MTARGTRSVSESKVDSVYRGLRQAIIELALKPGAKLPEDSVGESFGVSRTIVRTALARLMAEGLVSQQPNRRATVAAPTLEDARDLFRVRRGLERTVVEILSGHLTRDQAAKLLAHVDAEDAVQSRGESPTSIRLAGEFHTLLADMTCNEILARYVNEMVWRGSLVLALYGRPHSADCAVCEHRDLIKALVAGDTARATKMMDDHLAGVASRALLEQKAARELDLTELLLPYARPQAGEAATGDKVVPLRPAGKRGRP